MLTWLTGRKDTRIAAQRLYDGIVAQSRLPVFYIGHGVPDTVTGRFEMIVMHMFLVLERLQAETGEGSTRAGQISQALTEAFIGEMDSAMREMGVADVRVGKRMHQAAGAYFGRLMAYRKAIELPPGGAGQIDPLAAAIARNVLAEAAPLEGSPEDSPGGVAGRTRAAIDLAAYMRAAASQLAHVPLVPLEAGAFDWPSVGAMDKHARAPQ